MSQHGGERAIALEALLKITEKGEFSHVVLKKTLDAHPGLGKQQRSFITRLVLGTLERQIELDYILNHYAKTKTKKMKPAVREILRTGVYQLLYMDSVPDHAAINEAVKLTQKKGYPGLKGFVNGVLRAIARDNNENKLPAPADEMLSAAVRYSLPEWMLRLFCDAYGRGTALRMAEAFLKPEKTTIRCCKSRISPEELKTRLAREMPNSLPRETAEADETGHALVKLHPYLPYALVIDGYDRLEDLPSFREGLFSVQDVSSMLAVDLAGVKPGWKIIDVCAAPGGKALHAAETLLLEERKMPAGAEKPEGPVHGHVEARDRTEYKVNLIRENAARLKLDNVSAVCRDAALPDAENKGTADLVIADLPCSGLGVLGKKPDMKYRIREEDLAGLQKLQRQILTQVQALVREGGILMYSTCTVNPGENIENVRWFLENFPKFAPDDIANRLCPELAETQRRYTVKPGEAESAKAAEQPAKETAGTYTEEEIASCCIQLLPGVHSCDGFFIARLKRQVGDPACRPYR